MFWTFLEYIGRKLHTTVFIRPHERDAEYARALLDDGSVSQDWTAAHTRSWKDADSGLPIGCTMYERFPYLATPAAIDRLYGMGFSEHAIKLAKQRARRERQALSANLGTFASYWSLIAGLAVLASYTKTMTVIVNIPDLTHCPECQAEWKYTVPCQKCSGTGRDADGQPRDTHSCAYNPETEKFDGECTAHCCQDGIRGPFSNLIGCEYDYTSPERYDGVSEWLCPSCQSRWGRWSGRKLADGELEKRFGGQ